MHTVFGAVVPLATDAPRILGRKAGLVLRLGQPPRYQLEDNLGLDKRGGYVKVWRSILDSPFCLEGTLATKWIAIVCICEANYRPKKRLDGSVVPRGSFMTTLADLAQTAGVSVRNVRTALSVLQVTGFLTNEATNQGRMITITNYNRYQSDKTSTDKQTDKQATSERQATFDNSFEINAPRGAKKVRREEEEEREAFHLRGVLQTLHEYGDHAEEREGKNGLPGVDALAQQVLRALQDPRT